MLTGDLIRPRLKQRGDQLTVDMVDVHNSHWLSAAEELISLFNSQTGKTSFDWDSVYESFEGDRMDYIVLRGLAKVLSDGAEFTVVETVVEPVKVRECIFAQGPSFDQIDLFHRRTRQSLMVGVAAELGITCDQVEAALFADLGDERILSSVGRDWTPVDLLARYNLELARGVLYWASELQVEVYDNFKDFFKYVKLFKLMFDARRIDSGYSITLDGPISPFIKSTTRYGQQFASFLPALFLCEKWSMQARVRAPQSGEWTNYSLSHNVPLVTHFKRSGLFDSSLERNFAAEFEEKFGGERGKWLLTREDEILLLGDRVMIPDFAVTHKKDGRRALIELVGFWHPDYLRRKIQKVLAAQRRDLILVVYEGINVTEESFQGAPGEVLFFKDKPVLRDIMTAIEKVAQ